MAEKTTAPEVKSGWQIDKEQAKAELAIAKLP